MLDLSRSAPPSTFEGPTSRSEEAERNEGTRNTAGRAGAAPSSGRIRIQKRPFTLTDLYRSSSYLEDAAMSDGDASGLSKVSLPPAAVTLLKDWMLSPEHIDFPYPTDEVAALILRWAGLGVLIACCVYSGEAAAV